MSKALPKMKCFVFLYTTSVLTEVHGDVETGVQKVGILMVHGDRLPVGLLLIDILLVNQVLWPVALSDVDRCDQEVRSKPTKAGSEASHTAHSLLSPPVYNNDKYT